MAKGKRGRNQDIDKTELCIAFCVLTILMGWLFALEMIEPVGAMSLATLAWLGGVSLKVIWVERSKYLDGRTKREKETSNLSHRVDLVTRQVARLADTVTRRPRRPAPRKHGQEPHNNPGHTHDHQQPLRGRGRRSQEAQNSRQGRRMNAQRTEQQHEGIVVGGPFRFMWDPETGLRRYLEDREKNCAKNEEVVNLPDEVLLSRPVKDEEIIDLLEGTDSE